MAQAPNQLLALIASVLPQAEQVLRSGQLEPLLSPPMVAEAIAALAPQLPQTDVILTLDSDEAALIFELSVRLKIPFVSAKLLDLVVSDDTSSNGFLSDSNLLQVRVGQDTFAIAKGSIPPNSRVLIFRDVLASGANTIGLLHLTRRAGANSVAVATLIEKSYFGARSRLAMQHIEVHAAVILSQKDNQIIFEQREARMSVLHKTPSDLL
jgi:adenine/guanine phosphoribosyltransferase-like PRPP-binding protein